LLKKLFFLPKQIDFPKIKYKNVEHFNLVYAQKPFFFYNCPFRIFFIALFRSFFSAFLLWLLFAFHILSGCRKNLGVNYGQSLEMGP